MKSRILLLQFVGLIVLALSLFAPAKAEELTIAAADLKFAMAEVWDSMQSKLVQGENIAHTAQFVDSGAAEADIIASGVLGETLARLDLCGCGDRNESGAAR